MKSGMTEVFYHANCPDGLSAAWVASNCLPGCNLHSFGSNDRISDVEGFKGADVFFLDVAPQFEDAQKLVGVARKVVVLDHHLSNFQKLKHIPNIFLVTSDTKCAFRIAWEYFVDDQPVPWFLTFVEMRDLWKIKSEPDRMISWSICDMLRRANSGAGEQGCFQFLNTLYACTKWIWKPVYTVRWNQFCVLIDGIIQKLTPMLLQTPNGQMSSVCVVKTKHLWAASDIYHVIKPSIKGCVLMLYNDNARSPTKESTCAVNLRGFGSLSIAVQFGGGGHFNAAGFRIKTNHLSQILVAK